MLTGSNGEIFSTTEFWVKFRKIEEDSLISTLATKLLSLLLHVKEYFLKLKTNQRNRFTFSGTAAHTFTKDDLCDSDGKDGNNFQPTKK